MIPIEAIAGLLGTIVPPAFKFVKSMFGKKQDDPVEMVASLAESKPEVLPEYLKGLAELYKAKGDYFNRDVVDGQVAPWVKNARAAIRPYTVAISLAALVANGFAPVFNLPTFLDEGTRAMMGGWVGTWMGDRIDL